MTDKQNEFDLRVREYKHNLVRDLLSQCTTKQIAFFNRMYGSIDKIKETQMRTAYDQCKRTLQKRLRKEPMSEESE